MTHKIELSEAEVEAAVTEWMGQRGYSVVRVVMASGVQSQQVYQQFGTAGYTSYSAVVTVKDKELG